jgi:hypothetical protein
VTAVPPAAPAMIPARPRRSGPSPLDEYLRQRDRRSR